jgi:hypothetical protein
MKIRQIFCNHIYVREKGQEKEAHPWCRCKKCEHRKYFGHYGTAGG